MGRRHDQRQRRVLQDSGPGGLHRVRAARPGRQQHGSHSHDLSGTGERLRREGQPTVTARGAIATTAAVAVLLSIEGQAHRLDEYLQAARLSLVREGVAVELDLTPGVAVAPEIIAIIDRDADAAISPEEARAYGQAVMSDVRLTLDGHPVDVRLDR